MEGRGIVGARSLHSHAIGSFVVVMFFCLQRKGKWESEEKGVLEGHPSAQLNSGEWK